MIKSGHIMSLPRNQMRAGAFYAVAAYLSWGLFPAYWKLLKSFPAMEILAHRIIWSMVFFLLLLFWRSRRQFLAELLKAREHLGVICGAALLISGNWYLYIWAVNSGRVLEASLGYFINPLVNVLLGMIFLGERLTRIQWICVALAATGVLQLSIQGDSIPYVSLFLAFSFGTYGLIRKKLPLSPLVASGIEAMLLALPAAIYLLTIPSHPEHQSVKYAVLLILGGVVTGLPLLWFVEAARRIPLSMLGFFQYLAPSLQFLLAVFAYGETFTAVHARSFAFIWLALALYSADLARRGWKYRPKTRTRFES